MRGASALQSVLDQMPQREVRVLVVWQAILATDWARPDAGVVRRVRDPRARQYWDPQDIFAKRLRDRMKADEAHPVPRCCETDDGIPWDLVAVYPAGARWDETLPTAVFMDGPVWQVKKQLAEAITGLEPRTAAAAKPQAKPLSSRPIQQARPAPQITP